MSDPVGLVLVADDDDDMRLLERRHLELAGFRCCEARDGWSTLAAVRAERPDLVLLDVTMPDLDGLATLRALREHDDEVPVILVTSHAESTSVQLGLELGADDYVTKPFVPGELLARVRAVLRRSPSRPSPRPTSVSGEATVVIDLAGRKVLANEQRVELTRREFDLLVALVSSPGEVLSRQALLDQVWGSRPEWQDPATVTEHVRRLRMKLDGAGVAVGIETVRGVGYRFEPDPSIVARS